MAKSHRKQYLVIFAVLFVLTVLEVGVVYMGVSRAVLASSLISMALAKAMCVALFYMHLWSEKRALRVIVGTPLLVLPPLYAIVLMAEAAWRTPWLGQ